MRRTLPILATCLALGACKPSASDARSAVATRATRPPEPKPKPKPKPTPAPHSPEKPDPVALALSAPASRSASRGQPTDGNLDGALALPLEGPGFRFNPRRDPEARFGTVEMVQALMRAAAVVHKDLPGGTLTINDLSYEAGGPIPHHGSHQSGRDVDVLFYLVDKEGAPLEGVGAPLGPDGVGWDFRDLADATDDVEVHIDLGRTWRFLEALIQDPNAHLQRIFVVEHLRTLLLAHARRVGAPQEAVARFEELTCQPSYPHDDHFHFRFYCTPDDIAAGCEDSQPLYPWHRAHLAAAGAKAVITPRRRSPRRAKTTTVAEARAEAGPMHRKVKEFLDRRESWLDEPHPGRRYCR